MSNLWLSILMYFSVVGGSRSHFCCGSAAYPLSCSLRLLTSSWCFSASLLCWLRTLDSWLCSFSDSFCGGRKRKIKFLKRWIKKSSLHTDVGDSRRSGEQHRRTVVKYRSEKFLNIYFPIELWYAPVWQLRSQAVCDLRHPVSLRQNVLLA